MLSTSRKEINGSIVETRSSTSLVVHCDKFQSIATETIKDKIERFFFTIDFILKSGRFVNNKTFRS
jgi:hypothetical protein